MYEKETTIDRLCQSLFRKYETNDPFELAKHLKVNVEYDYIGSLKGYYSYINRICMIVINQNLDEDMRRLVCSHELGHDLLHRNLAAISPLQDSGFHSTAIHEIEANYFAASYLVSKDDFLEFAAYGYTDTQIAGEFNVPVELVRIKSEILRKSGIQLRIMETPNYNFMQDL